MQRISASEKDLPVPELGLLYPPPFVRSSHPKPQILIQYQSQLAHLIEILEQFRSHLTRILIEILQKFSPVLILIEMTSRLLMKIQFLKNSIVI